MSDSHYIPASLDAPARFALLTMDEAVLFFTPLLVLGFLCNALLTGFLLGAVGVMVLKKLKGGRGHYYALHWLYWHYPTLLRLKFTPSSSDRDYIG